MAMHMLENSTCGLALKQRCLIYRSCVMSITTYGLRLWFFDSARCKGNVEALSQMQCKAALWISGEFSTSLGGAVKSIAGLLPVHLLLKRMVTRSMGQLPSLSANHPIWPLLSQYLAGDALPAHPMSIANMCLGLVAKTCGSLMEVDRTLPDMANAMDVFAPEAQLGHCVVDCWNTVIFYDLDYWYLNEGMIKNTYPLPLVSDLMDKLKGVKYFTKFDVQ